MNKSDESRVAILYSTTLLGARIERAIADTKTLRGVDNWMFALFRRMILTSRAVEILLKSGFTADSKLLARANHEAFWDLIYLQHDASQKRKHEQMIYNEAVMDDYEQVEFMALCEGKQLRQYVKGWREGEMVIKLHGQLKKKILSAELSQTDRRKNPILWKDIPFTAKLKAASDLSTALDRFDYSIRTLGHASAHSRPALLYPLLIEGKDRHFRRTVIGSLFSKEWIAFEVSLCLLTACDRMVDAWFLGDTFVRRIKKIEDRLWAARKIK